MNFEFCGFVGSTFFLMLPNNFGLYTSPINAGGFHVYHLMEHLTKLLLPHLYISLYYVCRSVTLNSLYSLVSI